jgi:peroxiredoxin
VIIGVSPDKMEALEKFATQENIEFPLVSDMDTAVRDLYAGGRITYLIDKEGVVRFISEGVPNNDQLLEELKNM